MATQRQKVAAKKVVENLGNDYPKPLGEILLESGYSKNVADTPSNVTESKGFQDLLEEYLPDNKLTEVHKSLLGSTKLDHMIFPLGPENEDDENLSGSKPNAQNKLDKAGVPAPRTTLTDLEIKDMLAEVNCQVRRIVHGDTARHVYFWAADTGARQNALKLAYEVKGKGVPKDGQGGNTYNTFVQQNNINPNTPAAKTLVDDTLDYLMEKTKRENNPTS